MASRNITTLCDYYDGVCIRIFQGGAVSIKLDFHVPSKGVLTVLAKSKDAESEWSTEFKILDEIGKDGAKVMAKRAILFGRRNIEESMLLHVKCAVECTIEGIEKMICSTRKDFLPSYLRSCEGKLADLKKTMHSGDLPSLKSLLAEAARLEDEITKYIPSEPESTYGQR